MQKITTDYPKFLSFLYVNIPAQRGIRVSLLLLVLVVLLLSACANQGEKRVNLKNIDTTHELVSEKTLLMQAAEAGDSGALRVALLQGQKVNQYTEQDTAFSLALKNGHEAISRILLSAGSDWQRGFEATQGSALILAAGRGFDEIVKQLILKGAPLNVEDAQGYNALAIAAKNGHLTTMKILINAGAKVNVYPEGRSVLMHVVENNNMLLSQVLIAAGADVNYSDAEGETALKIARGNGYFDLDLMLVQSGARL